MSAKTKNPLYVVKGKDVQQVSGLFDLLMKKFDLEPIVSMLQQLLSMLLAQVQNYHVLSLVKGYLDQILAQLQLVFGRFVKV
jgi:Zn-dependent M16 (insulinase) family peptidase